MNHTDTLPLVKTTVINKISAAFAHAFQSPRLLGSAFAALLSFAVVGQAHAEYARIGGIDIHGNAIVKEGALGTQWVVQAYNVNQIALSGDRIGIVINGDAYVKEGSLYAEWHYVGSNVKQIVLSAKRIGLLYNNGDAAVNEGALDAEFVVQAYNVSQIALSGERIGLVINRQAVIKEGGLYAYFYDMGHDVDQLVLSGKRVGLLKNGDAYVKETPLAEDGGWVWEYGNVKQLSLSSSRIGVVTKGGDALVKEGGLSTAWVTEAYGVVKHLDLGGDRISVIEGTEGYTKEGGLSTAWTLEHGVITSMVNNFVEVDREAIARKYAPVIMLHPEERFMPSSVEFYAPNVDVKCNGVAHPEVSILNVGNSQLGTDNCHLTTKQALGSPSDLQNLFYGQNPAQTPVPVYVSIYNLDANRFVAEYKQFYPYNFGKMVCPSVAPNDNCFSSRVLMDNHVGDWEGASIEFTNGVPTRVFVGAHETDKYGHTYDFSHFAMNGTHPLIYSALGSHGVWDRADSFNYKTLDTGDRLVDHTSNGIAWNAADTMQVIAVDKIVADNASWMKYKGRWGNPPMGRNACDLAPIDLLCEGAAWIPAKPELSGACWRYKLPSWMPGSYSREDVCHTVGIPTDEYELNIGPGTPELTRDIGKFPMVNVVAQ